MSSQSQSQTPQIISPPSDTRPSVVDGQRPSSTGATAGSTGNSTSDLDDDGYPPQRHSGAVGYGPEYNQGVGFGEKLTGLKEEVKGKITRKPDLVEHGRERRTGELKRRQQESDNSAFEDPAAKQKQQQSHQQDPEDKRAATVDAGQAREEPNANDYHI